MDGQIFFWRFLAAFRKTLQISENPQDAPKINGQPESSE